MTKRSIRSTAFALTALTALLAVGWTAPAAAALPLQGRTVTGVPVASTDPSAVMEYDPNLNITWLRDWNKHGPFLFWNDAQSWASTLKVGNFGGWSLPSAVNAVGSPPCVGYGIACTGLLGYMYTVELGNLDNPAPGYGMVNKGPFQNVQSSVYWTNTAYSVAGYAWGFNTQYGFQSFYTQSAQLYAVAVRAGDVAAAVPEPQVWATLLMGLCALAVARRRRSA